MIILIAIEQNTYLFSEDDINNYDNDTKYNRNNGTNNHYHHNYNKSNNNINNDNNKITRIYSHTSKKFFVYLVSLYF